MNCLVDYSDSSDEEERRAWLSSPAQDSYDDHELEQNDVAGDESKIKSTIINSEKTGTSTTDVSIETVLNRNIVESESSKEFEVTITSAVKRSDKPKLSGSAEPPYPQNVELEPSQKRRKFNGDPSADDTLCLKSTNRKKNPLTLPSAIQSMFCGHNAQRQWADNPAQHGNRIRSFPHVEGNWATHVFIPVERDVRLVHLVHGLVGVFSTLPLEVLPEFHISLSRTVAIRHHWIQPLVNSLQATLSPMHSCVGDLEGIRFYSNDEKTRSFLCMEVSKEDTALLEYVSGVDQCFQGFKLPTYYQDPSFHVSVASCLGDVCHSVTPEQLTQAKKLLVGFCEANPELSVVFVRGIHCQTGNKTFVIPLVV